MYDAVFIIEQIYKKITLETNLFSFFIGLSLQ